jgi:hypothetical protein
LSPKKTEREPLFYAGARLGRVVAFDFASRYHTPRIQAQDLVTVRGA